MWQFHTVLEDYDRDVKYRTPPEYVKCDYNLTSGWYRFLNISGITMPTTCPPLYSCSTKFPGWLKGDHPTVDEGEVKRTVCFSEGSGWCCEEASLIWVKNCSSFYVYHLPSLAKCPYSSHDPSTSELIFAIQCPSVNSIVKTWYPPFPQGMGLISGFQTVSMESTYHAFK